jgi:hypothetical protein
LKNFRRLLNRNKIFRTDHGGLTDIAKTPQLLGQQAKWLGLLVEHNFEIRYRSGYLHENNDALSRHGSERSSEIIRHHSH